MYGNKIGGAEMVALKRRDPLGTAVLVQTCPVCTTANADYFLQFRLHFVSEPWTSFRTSHNLASAMLTLGNI